MACALAIMACGTSPWNQEQADSRVSVGAAYLGSGRSNDALKEFLEAEKLSPRDPKVHYFMGISYLEKGLKENAIDEFKNALANALYETPDKAIFNMGTAYHGKGDYEKALKMYDEAKNKQPHTIPAPVIDLNVGRTYYDQGNLEKAVAYFKASLKTAPSLLESRYWLGQCYIKQRDPEKAKAEFKAIIDITPDSGLGIEAKKSLDSITSSR